MMNDIDLKLEDHMKKITGHLFVDMIDAKTGRIIETYDEGSNLVVTTGKQLMGDLLIGATSSTLLYCGIGDDNTAASVDQIDLISQIGSRVLAVARSRSGIVINLSFYFLSTQCNGVWREAGIFTSSAGGIMYARKVLPIPLTKDISKCANAIWLVTIG